MDEKNKIGVRIRELRESQNLGRHAFSEMCGVNKRSLENIEMGRQRATEEVIVSVAMVWPNYSQWLLTGNADIEENDPQIKPSNFSKPDTPDTKIVDTYVSRKDDVQAWIDDWWTVADSEERSWFIVEMKRRFPEFSGWLKKSGRASRRLRAG